MNPAIASFLARGPKAPEQPPEAAKALDWVVNRKLQGDPEKQSEIQRICRLPIAQPLSPEEVEAISQLNAKPEAFETGFRLQPVQAEAIQTFSEIGTVFGPIEVGAGKTLIALRCIAIAFEKEQINRAILFVPPNVYSQIVEHDINWARRRVPLGYSFHLLGGKSQEARRSMTGSRRGCWVMPYSLLSTKDSYEMLEAIRPDLIVADEAHNLKNRQSARTKRVLAYWRRYRPRFMALSGTMTAKSLRDYAHLLLMCLGEGSPLPNDMGIVDEWAIVLDSEQSQEGRHLEHTNTGALRPLINWSNAHFPDRPATFNVTGFRKAYQNRLNSTPGVVTSPAGGLGVSLVIENRKPGPANAELSRLFQQLNDYWITPDGDEIEHAMMVWKWRQELTAGIYNSLVWPTVEAKDRERLERSKQYHQALQEYHRELRSWFKNYGHRPGCDTPMLVGSEMARHGAKNVGSTLFTAWQKKNDLDFNGRIERLSVPVRVCDYKINLALQWAKNKQDSQGIVWYYHQEMGNWLFEELQKLGVPSVHCPAGKASNEFLTKPDADARCRGKILVCSISAHGTGKNLQFMTDQFFLQLPPTEQIAQQSIARTHRTGQKADEVTCYTTIANETDEMALAANLNDAMYVFETLNSQRKLLIASWNPVPTIYASTMLRRAGASVQVLSDTQQQMLADRFSR